MKEEKKDYTCTHLSIPSNLEYRNTPLNTTTTNEINTKEMTEIINGIILLPTIQVGIPLPGLKKG